MKKIAFMFVAAAMFVACGGQKAEAPAVEEVVEEVVEEAIDSAAAWAIVGDTAGLDADTIAAKFQAAVDSLKAAAAVEAPAAEEEAPAAE